MPEACIVRKVSQNRQRLMVYILAEIVTMIMDFLIYQQYQSSLLQAKVGLLRGVPLCKPAHPFFWSLSEHFYRKYQENNHLNVPVGIKVW